MEYVRRFDRNGTEAVLISFTATEDCIERHVSRQKRVEYFVKPETCVHGVQYPVMDGCDVRVYDCGDTVHDLRIVSVHAGDSGVALETARRVVTDTDGMEVNVGESMLGRYFEIEKRGLATETMTVSRQVA